MSLRFAGFSAALLFTLTTFPAVSPTDPSSSRAVSASAASFAGFEGRTIDLRSGWGAATACQTDGHTTQCWATEAEMDRAIGAMPVGTPATDGQSNTAALATCSSSLRLYSGLSYTGSVLALTSTGTLINLSTYGFDNTTTSYKVGACSALFYDGANGSGSQYPGSTSAFSQSASMATGWNDRVSSVYMF